LSTPLYMLRESSRTETKRELLQSRKRLYKLSKGLKERELSKVNFNQMSSMGMKMIKRMKRVMTMRMTIFKVKMIN